MLGIDSNVLVRFFTKDDARQFAQASRLFERAEDRSLFLSNIVLVELSWTLRRVYKHSAKDVLGTLQDLTETRQFTVEDRETVVRAIALANETGADFPDALIALRNEALGASRTATFDQLATHIGQMVAVGDVLQ